MTWTLTDEQLALQHRARELANEVIAPRAAEIDETEEYPWGNVAALTDAGLVGMTIPVEFGGPGRIIVRCSARRGGDGQGLRGHRPYRGRVQHGSDFSGHGLRHQRPAQAGR